MATHLHPDPGGQAALGASHALLQAGLRLSARPSHAGVSDLQLAEAAGLPVERFRAVFGDLEAYLHVLQELLARELEQTLREALAINAGAGERLQRGMQASLEARFVRRGAWAWLENLARRSLPLRASARKHQLRFARVLQPLVSGATGEAEAQARLLAAALARSAREEARCASRQPAGREALAALARLCACDPEVPDGGLSP